MDEDAIRVATSLDATPRRFCTRTSRLLVRVLSIRSSSSRSRSSLASSSSPGSIYPFCARGSDRSPRPKYESRCLPFSVRVFFEEPFIGLANCEARSLCCEHTLLIEVITEGFRCRRYFDQGQMRFILLPPRSPKKAFLVAQILSQDVSRRCASSPAGRSASMQLGVSSAKLCERSFLSRTRFSLA